MAQNYYVLRWEPQYRIPRDEIPGLPAELTGQE